MYILRSCTFTSMSVTNPGHFNRDWANHTINFVIDRVNSDRHHVHNWMRVYARITASYIAHRNLWAVCSPSIHLRRASCRLEKMKQRVSIATVYLPRLTTLTILLSTKVLKLYGLSSLDPHKWEQVQNEDATVLDALGGAAYGLDGTGRKRLELEDPLGLRDRLEM